MLATTLRPIWESLITLQNELIGWGNFIGDSSFNLFQFDLFRAYMHKSSMAGSAREVLSSGSHIIREQLCLLLKHALPMLVRILTLT